MASNARITLAVVAKLKPGETVWDTDVKGFGVRYRASTISYVFKKRIGGKQTWVTIGRHGSPWTPETARRKALSFASDALEGINPNDTRKAEAAKLSFADVSRTFLDQHTKKIKASTATEYARLMRLYLVPAFGRLKVEDITRSEVARAHTSWAPRPRAANHALAVLSKFMNWCEEHGYRAEHSNPCTRIKKYREEGRERYLSNVEIQRLLAVLTELEASGEETPFICTAFRLLLLTGARLSEITTLKWTYVDLDAAALRLPDSKTGKKVIRLNAPALEVLRALPRVSGNPYVIVGHRNGAHIINLQKPWRRIRALAGLDDVRIHDLRHSFASIAINSGASLAMVGQLLGHTRPETTARYAHLADDPLRLLNEQIGQSIASQSRPATSEIEGEADSTTTVALQRE